MTARLVSGEVSLTFRHISSVVSTFRVTVRTDNAVTGQFMAKDEGLNAGHACGNTEGGQLTLVQCAGKLQTETRLNFSGHPQEWPAERLREDQV